MQNIPLQYRFLEKLSREVGSHFHALDRTTLYTANRDISYYTVHESFVATIPLVFCEAEKMDPNTQFLKVMMIDEPAILDQATATPDRFSGRPASSYRTARSEFHHRSVAPSRGLFPPSRAVRRR